MQNHFGLVISRSDIDAVVFDLDGVLTDTARIHAAVWKTVFDDVLRRRAERGDQPFRPFEDIDYRAHVDGRPRLYGIRALLASRGIRLLRGTQTTPRAPRPCAASQRFTRAEPARAAPMVDRRLVVAEPSVD
jgi:beta-phosphoglucomutase-like phosphatase (HAD superfamily)